MLTYAVVLLLCVDARAHVCVSLCVGARARDNRYVGRHRREQACATHMPAEWRAVWPAWSVWFTSHPSTSSRASMQLSSPPHAANCRAVVPAMHDEIWKGQ